MLRNRIRQGIRAGLIAAAATAGALIGFGLARGAPFRALNAVAHMAIGSRAFYVTDFDLVTTPIALALHAASVVAWGLLFALVAGRLRGVRLAAVAVLTAGVAFAVDYYVVPARLRPGFEATLSAGEMVATYAVLALSLTVGLRLGTPTDEVA